jgi:hypothetical protein
VEGYETAALNATLWNEYESCLNNTDTGKAFSTTCTKFVLSVKTITGCTAQCMLEQGLVRSSACGKVRKRECAQAEAPACPQWDGKSDDYGAESSAQTSRPGALRLRVA